MKYNVTHHTRYDYAGDVSLSHNNFFLTPRQTPTQTCIESNINLNPFPASMTRRQDYFGNTVTSATIQTAHRALEISAESRVEFSSFTDISPEQTLPWDHVRSKLWKPRNPEDLDAFQFAFASPMIPTSRPLLKWAADLFQPGTPVLQAALALTEKIYTEFEYDPEATTTTTSVEKAFDIKKGVCQDFAHIEIACLRSLGLAARYVSGYLNTLPPPGTPKLVGNDASHAWLALYIPDTGWVDLDPTNNVIPSNQHITLAWGRDYNDVTPVRGTVLGGGDHQLTVSVDVIQTDT